MTEQADIHGPELPGALLALGIEAHVHGGATCGIRDALAVMRTRRGPSRMSPGAARWPHSPPTADAVAAGRTRPLSPIMTDPNGVRGETRPGQDIGWPTRQGSLAQVVAEAPDLTLPGRAA